MTFGYIFIVIISANNYLENSKKKKKKIVLCNVVNAAFKKEARQSNLNDTEFAFFACGICILPKKRNF